MIFWCYTVAVASVLIAPLFPRAEELGDYSGSWWLGSCYVAACYFSFVAAYAIRASLTRLPEPTLKNAARISRRVALATTRKYPDVSTLYLTLLAAWAMIGAGIIILQVQTTLGFGAYLSLLSQGAKGVETARGATILVDSSAGGLPGFIKVWNQNCTTSALVLIFLLAEGHKVRGLLAKTLAALVAFCYVLRNFIAMDRLALLALVPASYYLWKVGSWRVRKMVLLVGAVVLCLAQIQSMRRDSHNGALGFFLLYVQSGMVNANLMIDTLQGGHTNGFASVFSALYWLLKAVGINVINPNIQYNFIWNDAHNSYGLLFLDFGWLGPVLALGAGAMAQRFDRPALYRGVRADWRVIGRIRTRALLAYAALSSMFVPAYVGPEFTIALVSLAMTAWLEKRLAPLCFKRRKRIPSGDKFPLPAQIREERPRPAFT